MRTLTTTLALVLATAGVAAAAQPKTPAQFNGGGNGAPVTFTLNKNGRVTSAAASYVCKGQNGIGFAQSKGKPRGHVRDDGSLVIRYRYKDSDQPGKLRIRLDVTFPTRRTAKGPVRIRNKHCKAKGYSFTAQEGGQGEG